MVMLQDNRDTGAGVVLGDEEYNVVCRGLCANGLCPDIWKCRARILRGSNIVKEFEDENMVRERLLLGVHRDPGAGDSGRDSGD